MKIYKKSEIGRDTILKIIILLAVLLAVAFVIWELKGTLVSFLDKLFT